MKFTWRHLLKATLLVMAVLLGGCGGISMSDTISPASFFLPGVQVKPLPAPTADPVPLATNSHEVLMSSRK